MSALETPEPLVASGTPAIPEIPEITLPDKGEAKASSSDEEEPKEPKRRSSRSRKRRDDERSDDQSMKGEDRAEEDAATEAPKPRRRRRRAAVAEGVEEAAKTETPKRRPRAKKTKVAAPETTDAAADKELNDADNTSSTVVINVGEKPVENANPRRGWWSRT